MKYKLSIVSLICVIFLLLINFNIGNFSVNLSFILFILLIIGAFDFELLLLIYLALYPLKSAELMVAYVSGMDITFNRIFVIIILILFLFKQNNYEKVKYDKFIFFIFILILWDLLTVFFSDSQYSINLTRFVSFQLEVFFLGFVYLKCINKDDIELVIYSFGVGIFIVLACGIIERLTNVNLLYSFPTLKYEYFGIKNAVWLRDNVLRVRTSFGGPVQYAGFFALILIIPTYLLLMKKYTIGLIFAIMTLINLFLTVTRTGYFSVISYLILISIFFKIKPKYIISIIIIFVLVFLISPNEFNRFYDIISNPTADKYEGYNTYGRQDIFSIGLEIISEINPFGLGFNYLILDKLSEASAVLRDIANFYIFYAFTKGIYYMLLFLVFIGLLFQRIFNYYKINQDNLSLILLSAFIATFIAHLGFSEIHITLPVILIFYFSYIKTNNIDSQYNNIEL